MQVESTVAMQNIAPRVKAIQEEYKGRDQQEMQIKVGQLYKEAGINPLAGCLPTLATLPVWIGLYRCCADAVLTAAAKCTLALMFQQARSLRAKHTWEADHTTLAMVSYHTRKVFSSS